MEGAAQERGKVPLGPDGTGCRLGRADFRRPEDNGLCGGQPRLENAAPNNIAVGSIDTIDDVRAARHRRTLSGILSLSQWDHGDAGNRSRYGHDFRDWHGWEALRSKSRNRERQLPSSHTVRRAVFQEHEFECD